jgi:hypothetical protein
MKIIHYTVGYGGKLNYFTTCGKEIHSHSETEDATVDPAEVTCDSCKSNKQWKEDFGYRTGSLKEEIRRIFIESDIIHADELRGAQTDVYMLCKKMHKKCIKRVFSEVLDHAWHDLEKTWEAVKKADEIYANSSLMPLVGGSYIGAPVIFNGMCERALKEGIDGKSVFILNKIKDIYWEMIDIPLMKKAFKKNSLYMYDEKYDIQKVDVSKINKNR